MDVCGSNHTYCGMYNHKQLDSIVVRNWMPAYCSYSWHRCLVRSMAYMITNTQRKLLADWIRDGEPLDRRWPFVCMVLLAYAEQNVDEFLVAYPLPHVPKASAAAMFAISVVGINSKCGDGGGDDILRFKPIEQYNPRAGFRPE